MYFFNFRVVASAMLSCKGHGSSSTVRLINRENDGEGREKGEN